MVGTLRSLSTASGPSDVLYADMLLRWSRWHSSLHNKRVIAALLAVASGVLAVAAYLLRTAGIALLWHGLQRVSRRRFRQAACVRQFLRPVLLWQGYV